MPSESHPRESGRPLSGETDETLPRATRAPSPKTVSAFPSKASVTSRQSAVTSGRLPDTFVPFPAARAVNHVALPLDISISQPLLSE